MILQLIMSVDAFKPRKILKMDDGGEQDPGSVEMEKGQTAHAPSRDTSSGSLSCLMRASWNNEPCGREDGAKDSGTRIEILSSRELKTFVPRLWLERTG